jgi:hypothetical protein
MTSFDRQINLRQYIISFAGFALLVLGIAYNTGQEISTIKLEQRNNTEAIQEIKTGIKEDKRENENNYREILKSLQRIELELKDKQDRGK